MKKFAIVLALVFFVACTPKVVEPEKFSIPDVIGVDEQTAKIVIANNDMIPKIEFGYDDSTKEGFVFKLTPDVGSMVEKNTAVKIYVSLGPSQITSVDSVMTWFQVYGSTQDKWEFYSPTIEEGTLKVEFTPTIKTKYSFEWQGFGYASINDTFSKSIPVKFIDTGNGSYTLEVPTKDLDVKKPTTLFIKLNALIDKVQKDVNIELRITWP